MNPTPITAIRRASHSDREVISEIATAAGVASIAGETLVAVSGQDVVAAIAVRDGRIVAGPSPAMGAAVHHLRERRLEVLSDRYLRAA